MKVLRLLKLLKTNKKTKIIKILTFIINKNKQSDRIKYFIKNMSLYKIYQNAQQFKINTKNIYSLKCFLQI